MVNKTKFQDNNKNVKNKLIFIYFWKNEKIYDIIII